MPSKEDQERLMRIAAEAAKARTESPAAAKASRGDAEQIIFETLEISQPTLRVAKTLFAYHDSADVVSKEMDTPEVKGMIARRHEIALLVRLGDNARFHEALAELEAKHQQFLQNDENHPRSRTSQRKYRKPDDLKSYVKKYSYFKTRVEALRSTTKSRLSGWTNQQVDVAQLSSENEFANITGKELGPILIAKSNELAQESRSLKLREYGALCELFLLVVRGDRQLTGLITHSKNAEEESLTKILLEMTAARAINVAQEFPTLAQETLAVSKRGIPLFKLFTGFVEELSEAIIDTDHPFHELSVELLTEINSFVFSGVAVPEEVSSQPFNFQFFHGLANKDFFGEFNYQDYILKLSELADLDHPNQEWYAAFRDFALSASRLFRHEIVYEASRAQTAIFKDTPETTTEINLQVALDEIFKLSHTPFVSVIVDGVYNRVKEFDFKSDQFVMHIDARRLKGNVYLINVVAQVVDEVKDLATAPQLRHKFRYQLRIEDGEVSAFFPVLDTEAGSENLKEVAIEQVRKALKYVRNDMVAKAAVGSSETSSIELTDRPGITASTKLGTHQQRIDEYSPIQKSQPDKPAQSTAAQDNTLMHSELAETDAVRFLVPSSLFVSPALQNKMEKQGKKGAFAAISTDTQEFIARYNEATTAKPGKGIQMTDIYGPNGETVWRFRPNYWTRAIAVSISEGEAVIIHVEYRDSVYGDAKDMIKMVARELDKYYREQGK